MHGVEAADGRKELMERYKLAYHEYRAEVTLGAERQRLFITLAPAVAAFVSHQEKEIVVAAFALSAAASLVGILLLRHSRKRRLATQAAVLRLADALGWDDIQRSDIARDAANNPRLKKFTAITGVELLLGFYALLKVGTIVALGLHW